MLFNTVSALALVTAVTASPLAAQSAVEPLSVQASCAWTGYGQTNFRDAYGSVSGNTGTCYKMPGSAWENALFSAKVTSGGSVCLFTGKTSCSGGSQVIDTAGYRDMTNLPAYYTWRCGNC